MRSPHASRSLVLHWLYATSLLVGVAAWQGIASQVPGVVFAPASDVFIDLWRGIFVTGDLLRPFFGSLGHMIVGFVVSLVTAVPLGFLMGRDERVFRFLNPTLSLIYAIPPVAFVPFMIVWFGIDFGARVALVVLMSFFEILLTVTEGARAVPPKLVEVARSFNSGRTQLVFKVLIPASYPFLFTAFRIGLVRAIHAMITAELFFAAVNLGEVMKDDAAAFNTSGMMAVILLLALFGLACQEGLKWFEGRMLPWHIRKTA